MGEMAKLHSSMAKSTPRLFELINESMIDSMQNSGNPAQEDRPDGLYTSNSRLQTRGSDDRFVLENSLYQSAVMHPFIAAGIAAAGGLAIAAMMGALPSPRRRAAAAGTG